MHMKHRDKTLAKFEENKEAQHRKKLQTTDWDHAREHYEKFSSKRQELDNMCVCGHCGEEKPMKGDMYKGEHHNNG